MRPTDRGIHPNAGGPAHTAPHDRLPSAASMPESLRVCVYNYKGGAAKTTIVVNTAAALAHPNHGNKKTLLMDLDPQCNSTQFYHDDNVSMGGGRTLTKEEVVTTSTMRAASTLAHTVSSGGKEPVLVSDELHPTLEAATMDALVSGHGKTPLYRMMNMLFVEQEASGIKKMIEEDRHDLLSKVNVDELSDESEFGDNFWILEGDANISEFEPLIADAFSNCDKKPSIKHYGLISHMMQMFTEILKFDVIVIDCSPSNSALNKAVALSCDFILPPCMASLYSAGSVNGLLSTVLPGNDGWLGIHDKITKLWRESDDNRTPKTLVRGLEDWMLPATAPQLLPIMISNYPMGFKSEDMKFEPVINSTRPKSRVKSQARPKSSGDARVIKLMPTQFVYTIMNYVNRECKYITGHPHGPPNDFKGPLVRFRENDGRRVINFAMSAPIAISVSEQLGRSFVELMMIDFLNYMLGEQKTYDMLKESDARASEVSKGSAKRKRGTNDEVGKIDYGDDGRAFLTEVEMMKQRYSELARWLCHLLSAKRGPSAAASSSSGAAAASSSSGFV